VPVLGNPVSGTVITQSTAPLFSGFLKQQSFLQCNTAKIADDPHTKIDDITTKVIDDISILLFT
jgi:hypothetical protein